MSLAYEIERDDTLLDLRTERRRPQTASWLGSTIAGGYRVVRRLGSGGMGQVFLVEHTAFRALAAAKVLNPGSPPEFVRQFVQEARLLLRQNHPNIIHVFELGELVDDRPYLLMEYAPGTDLERWLQGDKARPFVRSTRILRQVAGAIDHLHSQGILHRDIKPANIMLETAACDRVKLIDFGIAVREGQVEADSKQRLFGTPAYMAPEQAAGERCSRASDVYALGALALELLTGKPPHDDATLNRLLAAIVHETPALPSARGVRVAGLDEFFERALAREPARRFRTAGALVDALDRVLSAAARAGVELGRAFEGASAISAVTPEPRPVDASASCARPTRCELVRRLRSRRA